MKNYSIKILLILLVVVTITGCAQNPKGTFGPSWDVAYKVPLVETEVEKVSDMLSDSNDITVPDSDAADTRISFDSDFADASFPTVDIGGELTNVDLPTINETINLPMISLGTVLDSDTTVSIPGGVSADNSASGNIAISEFSSITFSDADKNKMGIQITAPNFDINSITLTLSDSSSGDLGSVDFATINAGTTSETKYIDLGNDEITGDISIEVSDLDTTGSGSEDMTLDYSISDVEISRVEGYNLGTGVTASPSTTVSLSQSGVESVAFSNGDVSITGIDAPAGSNLDFTVDSLTVGSHTANSSGTLDLTGKSIAVSGQDIDLGVGLTVSGNSITYDTSDQLTVNGGFNNDTIESATLASSYFTNNNLNTTFDEQIMTDISEHLSKLTLNDATLDLTIAHGINNLALDLSGVEFQALASDGTSVSAKSLKDLDKDDTAEITAGDDTISLQAGALLDWLGNLDEDVVSEVVLVGDVAANPVDTNQSVTISASSAVDPAMSADIKLDFSLNEDLVEKMTPSAVDALKQDDVDNLKNVIKETRLIISELNNQLPLGIELDIYVATIDEWADLSDQELENLSDAELDKLYKEANLLQSISINRDTKEKKEIVLDPEDGDQFTEDNVYVGIQYTIPSGDIVLNSDDKIEITDAFVKLVTKVNQGGDK